MFIKSLELKNFRNYEELKIGFDEKVNILIGNNAQGKTNMIEAIYLASMGRSFRTIKDSELIRFGESEAFVRVEAEKELTDTKVELRIGRGQKKYIRKDGSAIRRMSELLRNIVIVVFSPEDLKIVKEEPEKRRKFMDRELLQIKPLYYESLAGYRKALLQRNAYLKEEKVERDVLDMWSEQMARFGSRVIKDRKDFIERVSLYSGRIHAGITGGKEELTIKYKPNVDYLEDPGEQEALFREMLEDAAESDLRNRTTTVGPHKDDLEFFVDGVNARSYGSQGQQRTCALALKLAELDFIREETGEQGVLLLDDVMSELDEERRKYLIGALEDTQLFITTTDIDRGLREEYPDAKIVKIRAGKIE